jgi:ribonuclease P protein component
LCRFVDERSKARAKVTSNKKKGAALWHWRRGGHLIISSAPRISVFDARFQYMVHLQVTFPGEGLKRFSFPKKKRLVGSGQFKAVLDHRRRVSGELLMIYISPNDCGHPRLGISVARTCGGAVLRNRLKRLVREAFRRSQNEVPPGFDYLVMISPAWVRRQAGSGRIKDAIKTLSLDDVKDEFSRLVKCAPTHGGNNEVRDK